MNEIKRDINSFNRESAFNKEIGKNVQSAFQVQKCNNFIVTTVLSLVQKQQFKGTVAEVV
jgi:hypothetical protein